MFGVSQHTRHGGRSVAIELWNVGYRQRQCGCRVSTFLARGREGLDCGEVRGRQGYVLICDLRRSMMGKMFHHRDWIFVRNRECNACEWRVMRYGYVFLFGTLEGPRLGSKPSGGLYEAREAQFF